MEKQITIDGMSCTACAVAIEKGVGKLKGVSLASVNYASEKLVVEYDDSLVDFDIIATTIDKLGYKAQPEAPKLQQVSIPIEGMTCSACSAAIE